VVRGGFEILTVSGDAGFVAAGVAIVAVFCLFHTLIFGGGRARNDDVASSGGVVVVATGWRRLSHVANLYSDFLTPLQRGLQRFFLSSSLPPRLHADSPLLFYSIQLVNSLSLRTLLQGGT
jgi:hypothetical protein